MGFNFRGLQCFIKTKICAYIKNDKWNTKIMPQKKKSLM